MNLRRFARRAARLMDRASLRIVCYFVGKTEQGLAPCGSKKGAILLL